jgi:UDP-N-acetyl-D-galactosamine dehydrogenase
VKDGTLESDFDGVGLGYVGLHIAMALANKGDPAIGFDVSSRRISTLRDSYDARHEVEDTGLRPTTVHLSEDADALSVANFFGITVPTPIDAASRPDLAPLGCACALIEPRLRREAVVVFESAVYPGLTREICVPLLAKSSGLQQTWISNFVIPL